MASGVKFPLSSSDSVLILRFGKENDIPEHTKQNIIGQAKSSSSSSSSSSYSAVVLMADSLVPFSDSSNFAKGLNLTQPGGKIVFIEPVGRKNPIELVDEILFSGGTDTKIENDSQYLILTTTKPSWEEGTATQISKTSSAWVLDADDLVEDDIVNEDELLTEEDLVKPDTKAYDCGTSASGARKACKGCVCGLAEELEQENATIKKKTPAQASACGNCSLGDAFRCASCPYLGQPAFKPGEEVLLDI
eukprot:CAMPEP_0201486730 /NCGR_PEP_ID=MMETSP0151_2-20130828/10784_1 /ASSEMBLY_ACC=CAM_ASM_000257 /TAXON_ID=200890 /ORGANISM="Paramoeba atlantica, Strain 621/1 / CCAP 1560/9" /LENGTH=247 /DNA_ID=CAMNT_0047871535 /DNA_START=118 /DNA_END=861 /DNA_ORIENTATION=-